MAPRSAARSPTFVRSHERMPTPDTNISSSEPNGTNRSDDRKPAVAASKMPVTQKNIGG